MKNPSLLDNLIYVVIILFILSVITEKITQLIRYYPRQFQILSICLSLFFYVALMFSFPFPIDEACALGTLDFWVLLVFNTICLVLVFLNLPIALRSKLFGSFAKRVSILNFVRKGEHNTSDDAKELKERDVTVLSFLVGFIITYLFNADMKALFTEPDRKLEWGVSPFLGESIQLNPDFFGFDLSMGLGFLITGFFLSFGSKFFHDLVDTLLQVKNLKRKLNEEATFEAETIEQFDEYLAKSATSIIDAAIAQNQQVFLKAELMIPPVHGKMYKDGHLVDCIDVHVPGNNRGTLPNLVIAKLSKGLEVKVPLNVILNVEMATALGGQGSAVANKSFPSYKGTICCLVKDREEKNLLLTCSHVLTNGSGRNSHGQLTSKVTSVIDGVEKGSFVWALCNDKFDIALVDPEGFEFKYLIDPEKERSLTVADMLVTRVRVVRQNRTLAHGMVVNYKFSKSLMIKYSDGDAGLADLIVLSDVSNSQDVLTYKGFTIEGDSGAAVYDENNHLIGMVVAGNTRFTYAMAMPEILKKIKAKIN